jgi:hypothetical protein
VFNEEAKILACARAFNPQKRQLDPLFNLHRDAPGGFLFGDVVPLHVPPPQARSAAFRLNPPYAAMERLSRRAAHFSNRHVLPHGAQPILGHEPVQVIRTAMNAQAIPKVWRCGLMMGKAHANLKAVQTRNRSV